MREAVGGILVAHDKKDEKGIKDALVEYERIDKLIDHGMIQLEAGQKDWSWKWLADTGNLCDRDWVWFKDDLEKAGVSKAEFDKKWK